MEVKSHVVAGNSIELYLPMPHPVHTGDAFSIVAGCDKLHDTCKNKFNNIVNRQAEDFIPGMDAVIETPNASASSGGGQKK